MTYNQFIIKISFDICVLLYRHMYDNFIENDIRLEFPIKSLGLNYKKYMGKDEKIDSFIKRLLNSTTVEFIIPNEELDHTGGYYTRDHDSYKICLPRVITKALYYYKDALKDNPSHEYLVRNHEYPKALKAVFTHEMKHMWDDFIDSEYLEKNPSAINYKNSKFDNEDDEKIQYAKQDHEIKASVVEVLTFIGGDDDFLSDEKFMDKFFTEYFKEYPLLKGKLTKGELLLIRDMVMDYYINNYLEHLHNKTDKPINEAIKNSFKNEIPVIEVFFNEVNPEMVIDHDLVDQYLAKETYKKLPKKKVRVDMLIPTQLNLDADNLSNFDGNIDTGAVLFEKDNEYYIVDGHHRISKCILNGETFIEAYVYENTTLPINESDSRFDSNKLKELRSYAKKMKYCEMYFKKIGSGSSRVVYDMGDGNVLKLAKNVKGLDQNYVEYSNGRYDNEYLFCPVYDGEEYEGGFLWLIMKKANKLTNKLFKEITGYPFDITMKYVLNNDPLSRHRFNFDVPQEFIEKIEDDEESFASELLSVSGNYGLPVADLIRKANLGWIEDGGERRVVLIDYGFNESVRRDHYSESIELLEQKKMNFSDKLSKKIQILQNGYDKCCEDLGIMEDIPELILINDINYAGENKSFACYDYMNRKIYCVIAQRNTADCMRSIAHELMHHKQNLEGRLYNGAGEDGTDIENEANSYAGSIMRRLGREMDNIYEDKERLTESKVVNIKII